MGYNIAELDTGLGWDVANEKRSCTSLNGSLIGRLRGEYVCLTVVSGERVGG